MTTQERQLLTGGKYVSFLATPEAQDEPQLISPDVPPALDGGPMETCARGVTDEDNAKMQVWWNKAMCNEMNIPEGYLNVAVLIIKWIKGLDQLKSEDEVSKFCMR
jgi:hypothetical protein